MGFVSSNLSWKITDLMFYTLIPVSILAHLTTAPYTKVEESFNVQAAHDVRVYGAPLCNPRFIKAHYDHFTFPGIVPRTFLGAIPVGFLSQVMDFIPALSGPDSPQFAVRFVLGMANAGALLLFQRGLADSLGKPTARWYALLQATQFHIPFYASRTLPNMFAFLLTTVAFAFLLPVPRRMRGAREALPLGALIFAAAIFRAEVAVLLVCVAASMMYASGNVLDFMLKNTIPCMIAFGVALALTVGIDSYFWQRWLWPEFEGFYYNVVEGRSSNWGTLPFLWYFTHALPRMLSAGALLIPVSLLQPGTRKIAAKLVFPCLVYAAVYSFQPHKEARFIYYVIPPLTAAAAMGANHLWTWGRTTKDKSDQQKDESKKVAPLLPNLIFCGIPVGLTGLAAALSAGMLLVSSLNYPGGVALMELSKLIAESHNRPAISLSENKKPLVHVHADTASCMTGVTLFGIDAASKAADTTVVVDRTEDPAKLASSEFWDKFAWILTADPQPILKSSKDWVVVGIVQGYSGINFPAFRRTSNTGDAESSTTTYREASILDSATWTGMLTRSAGVRMKPKIHILRHERKEIDTSPGSRRTKIN